MFNTTSKYFSIFNNTPPPIWVAHITRELLTCYTCSYYSSMDIASYMDDAKNYAVHDKKESVVSALKISSSTLSGWFNN